MENFVFRFKPQSLQGLTSKLEGMGVAIQPGVVDASILLRATGLGLTLTFYQSGKVLIQGRLSAQRLQQLTAEGLIKLFKAPSVSSWIGTDEAGKGDYFGPLVVAGVLMKKRQLLQLILWGVRDSKTLADSAIKQVAERIKRDCAYSIVMINPPAYNRLYRRLRNLNRILAWGHARVIENLLKKHPRTAYVLSDQFGEEKFLQKAQLLRTRQVKLVQKTHAEEDLAVAAASILARAGFLEGLAALGEKFALVLPKGAGEGVKKAREVFIQKYGWEKLGEVAKTHFRL